jgi:di-heme oxidoreductase (putative peroxidase)
MQTEIKLKVKVIVIGVLVAAVSLLSIPTLGQLIDKTRAPNVADAGIAKSLADQIGAGRGDVMTPNSSAFIIKRDPFRSIRRGRQLFQRKFTRSQGQGPNFGDGAGDINTDLAIGAGLADSCAACHGRPRGGAGFGGDVATRPDSRDAPHLFGLGLKEMLADEITADLRAIRSLAVIEAQRKGRDVRRPLKSKGVNYGWIAARPDGSVDASAVEGVDQDLRVRPFFAHGGTISIREFVVGALKNEMGLEAVDPDLAAAVAGGRVTTPSGMVLDGRLDQIEAPPTADPTADPDGDGVTDEIPTSLIDHFEFYLLNYFKPATYQQTSLTREGRRLFEEAGCAVCHVPDLMIRRDRRVADVETVYDEDKGIFNRLFATAIPLFTLFDDGKGLPPLRTPAYQPFLVKNIFTDFKRHDLGANFYERNYDGSMRTRFMTLPLWGVGSTAPYGHDGRSINLMEVILRHGGEARESRNEFARLSRFGQMALIEFLNSLVIFPPDDTASNLDPGNRGATLFPQFGHGSVKLTVLFNDPTDIE